VVAGRAVISKKGRASVSADKENYANDIAMRFKAGRISKDEMLRALAEYDAFKAAKRTQLYAIVSTVAAAVSAIASAVSVYLTYLGVVANQHH
jgi:hypothetical protein